MMLRVRLLPAWACLVASLVGAAEIVYVTDLSIFTVLAPCAASAISENVQSQTAEHCPEAVTDLQSCVCTKDNNFASISSGISKSVSYSCGSTASEDQASASSVFEAYCNQDSITPFPTPTSPVTQYITDFPAWQELAPCAAGGLSYIVQSMTYDLCPAEPSLLATCVCGKNQNSLRASQSINTSVKSSCSSHTADIESAQAVFAAYCGLVDGTTSFPTTSDPPGDMTYYITALPEFSSLASCAQYAVSWEILSQTNYLCPSGPQALASCACIKSGMSNYLSNAITSDVKYSCDSTATEDVSIALRLFDTYCSAAKGLTTVGGVTESVQQTSATGNSGVSSPKETGVAGGSETSSSSGSNGGTEGVGKPGEANSSPNIGTIVGAAVGAAAGVAIFGLVAFFFWRRSRLNRGYNQPVPSSAGAEFGGKPELDGGSNLSPSKGHAIARVDNVSPISASSPNTSELQDNSAYSPLQNPNQGAYSPQTAGQHYPYSASEAYSQPLYEAPGHHGPQVHEAHGQPRAELQGMGWQSGPVAEYHEMDEIRRG
ncbi:uncharacterized protein F4822DRAFT_408032 [Hypoxylon trugodes]|uniref:uncharacterized protein n=1 Tax=Hypoxylon trugodes TaxID=326681 RepID=UPI00219C94AA|nr:uncharacterized protein F4822DRAFT_408032 [Hypoxylon trugodes]KAI1387936.1 hypothetical protein F4822DRAFT_408032 [Hypoxylon trugodes]